MDEIVLKTIVNLISQGLQDKSLRYEIEKPHDISYYMQKGIASELVLKVVSSQGKFKLKLPVHVQGLFYTGSGFMSTVNSLKRKSDILYKKGELILGNVVVKVGTEGIQVDDNEESKASPQISPEVVARLRYHTGYSGPDILCQEMVKSAIKLAKKRTDHMIDYYISTYDHALSKYLSSSRISRKIISNIKHTVSKKSPKLSIISDSIKDFLHAGTHSEYVTAVNAYTLISNSSKLKIPPYFLLNESFYDVVDVLDTPINSHVNVLNSICTGISVRGSSLYIEVYDKEFNLMSIPYEEYATSKVLVSDRIDYENKEVPEVYQILYRGEFYDGPSEYDFIQSEPEKRLGYLSNSIPMVNSSESTRTSMGINMLKQSVHAEGAEKPLVYAASLRSDLISLLSPVNGLVTSIGNEIHIDTGDDLVTLKIPEIPTIKDTKISYKPCISIGDHITKNQVLAIPTEFEVQGTGVNLIVAYASYKFKEHEDALILSESASKKLAVKQELNISYDVTDCKVNFIIEEGAIIDSDTVVLSYSKKTKGKYKSQVVKNESVKGIRYKSTVTKVTKSGDTIKIKVTTINLSGIGNKLTNRYGSKGVVGEILADELMPRFEINGRTYVVDVIMNPEAVYSRKNYSQINESELGLISRVVYDDYLEKGIDYVNEKYSEVLGHKITEPCSINDFAFNTKSFSKYNSLNIQEMLASADIDPYQHLYYPEYGNVTQTKVEVGVTYLLRLQQIPEYDIRSTPGISRHNLSTLGNYKAKGQAINEMETTAMIAGGAYDLVEHIKSKDAPTRMDKLGLYLLMSGMELTD